MFFEGWWGLLRIVVVGTLAYIGLIFFLRVFGKRSLSKWNAFDFVVTVALGSTLATALLSKDVPLAEAILAFFWLLTLQFIVTWLSIRSPFVENLVKSEPTLLFYKGEFIKRSMRRQRVPEEEVRAAVRAEGFDSLEAVEAVVLENDGSFSVITHTKKDQSAMKDVHNFDTDK